MAGGSPHPPYSPEKRDTDCHTSVATLARNDGGSFILTAKRAAEAALLTEESIGICAFERREDDYAFCLFLPWAIRVLRDMTARMTARTTRMMLQITWNHTPQAAPAAILPKPPTMV